MSRDSSGLFEAWLDLAMHVVLVLVLVTFIPAPEKTSQFDTETKKAVCDSRYNQIKI